MTEEMDAARPQEGPSPGLASRLVGVLLSPRSTFAAIVDRPRPFGALLVVCLCAATANGWLTSTELGQQMLLEQQIESMQAFGMTVTDEVYDEMARGLENAAYFGAAATFISIPIITFLIAGLVWTTCYVLLGAQAPFKAMYAVVTHAGAVSIVQQLFTVPLNYMRGAMNVPTTLAALLPMLEEGTFVQRTLGLVELFVVWQFFLLAVGTGVLFKRRTGPIATTFYSLYAVIAIAAGFIMSRLGG
jgi:hypothetical protein